MRPTDSSFGVKEINPIGSSSSGKGAVAVTGKKTLTSGVYLAGRHLAMDGLGSLGGHQFVVLIPKEAAAFSDATDLSTTTKGFTLGAYNENSRLQFSTNAPSDVGALKSYLSGDKKGSLGLEVVPVDLSKTGKGVDEAIKALVMAANR